MRLTDLLLFPLTALWQQKSRTALTTLGVAFGALVLAACLSINDGVQEMIARESTRTDVLRQISVGHGASRRRKSNTDSEIVVKGKMSEEKRQRIRAALALVQIYEEEASPSAVLTPETLQKLAAIPHVQEVEPTVYIHNLVHLKGESQPVQISAARAQDPAYLPRMVAGRFLQTRDEPSVVVSEFLLYRCGIFDDDAVASVLGQKLTIDVRAWNRPEQASLRVYLSTPDSRDKTRAEQDLIDRINKQIPTLIDKFALSSAERELLRPFLQPPTPKMETEERFSRDFTIVGVFRQLTDEERSQRNWWDEMGGSGDVYLPSQTAAALFFGAAGNRQRGLDHIQLIADSTENVKEIAKQVNEMGLHAHAPIEFIEQQQFMWRLILGSMTCVAAVALLVAAVGIANTMLMNVLERTREIGIMKAVGASATHIQMIFLIEGSFIGAIGGSLGLLMAWGAAIPGDTWVRGMVERDMNVKLRETLFVFPAWLVATVILFSILVTTIAAFYPARRAARVDPVTALRHE